MAMRERTPAATVAPYAGTPPRHVAIIMDGNGRWAKQRRLPRPLGHREGVKTVRRVVEACVVSGVEALTLFAFSTENWRRPELEVRMLMRLFLASLRREVERLNHSRIRLRFIGDRSAFSDAIQQGMARAEADTAANDRMTLVVAVNYGGRWDIAQAAQRLALKVEQGELRAVDVTAERLDREVSLHELPEPDLFIRTGGEERISNFLLWRMAYTEFHFSACLWPDYGPEQLYEAFDSFGRRQRRFGRTGDQVEGNVNA